MELYIHQQKLVDRNPKKHLLAWGVGTGKTRASLELAKKNNAYALVICPKNLKEQWRRSIDLWGARAHVVSKEEFKRDYQKLQRYDAVIVDECHLMFGNYRSQGHKALAKYFKVHNVTFRWLLTGTPYTSSAWSIYSMMKLLDYPVDFWDYRRRFFTERYFGSRCVFVPRNGVEDDVAEMVKKIGSVVRLDECIDVPEQTTVEEFFDMTKEQKKALNELKLNEQNPLVRFSKAHQIASGTLLGNEFTDTTTFPALKNEYIRAKMLENDKVAVFCRYNVHIDFLAEMCKKDGVPYRLIRGDVKDRDAVVYECENAKRMVVLINTACSVGYELPSFGVIIFASLDYSYPNFVQACGRFLRINKPKKNVYITCITKGSADVPVLEAMRRKESFSEAIYTKTAVAE